VSLAASEKTWYRSHDVIPLTYGFMSPLYYPADLVSVNQQSPPALRHMQLWLYFTFLYLTHRGDHSSPGEHGAPFFIIERRLIMQKSQIIAGSHPVTVPGILSVALRTGRKGTFATGALLTPLGQFNIKDTILDQYSEGDYEGNFTISQIVQESFVWKDRVITNMVAKLADISIQTIDEKNIGTEASPVVDPADQTIVTDKPVTIDNSAQSQTASVEVKPDTDAFSQNLDLPSNTGEPDNNPDSIGNDLENLFENDLVLAIAHGENLKLDPSVDRELFRCQRDYLKKNGYSFVAKEQAWVKA